MNASISLGLSAPLAIVADDGQLGVWAGSSAAQPQFLELQPVQLALLLQFCDGPCAPVFAARKAGIDYDENARSLIEAFTTFGLLAQSVTAQDDAVRLVGGSPAGDERAFELVPHALPVDSVSQMLMAAERSDFAGANPLADSFGGSRGFGVRWRAEAKPALLSLIPWIEPFVAQVMAWPWSAGTMRRPEPNAYYLNLLILPPGVGSGLHVDRTLNGEASPEIVSVLYLRVPRSRGGRLVLREHGRPIALIRPEAGNAVHFAGHLTHGVTPVTDSDDARVSLVCEQYHVPDSALAEIPYLEICRC